MPTGPLADHSSRGPAADSPIDLQAGHGRGNPPCFPAPLPVLRRTRVYARTIHHCGVAGRYRPGVGRPRTYDEPRVATAVRLPVSLRRALEMAAAERDVSVNFLVVRAVIDYLGTLPAPGDPVRDGVRPAPAGDHRRG